MKQKTASLLVLLMAVGLLLSGCGNEEKPVEKTELASYPVSITLVSEQNFILSAYDIRVLVDDVEQGVIDHGSKGSYTMELLEGEHKITLERADNETVLRNIHFDVPEETQIGYSMKNKKDTIELTSLEDVAAPITVNDLGTATIDEVKAKFDEAGFNNVKLKEIPDLKEDQLNQKNIVTDIKIGGTTVTNCEDEFYLDTEVLLEYHTEYKIVMDLSFDLIKDRNYAEVQKQLEVLGFKTIELEPKSYDEDAALGDCIITVWIGDCNLESEDQYKPGDAFSQDETVRIVYREYHEPLPILTIDNCPELDAMLKNKASNDPSYAEFSDKYDGETIEFDGRVDYLMEYQDDLGTYSMMVSAGDYDPNHMRGPAFRFSKVTAYAYDEEDGRFIDDIYVGRNIHIVAGVGYFNTSSEVFDLIPKSITLR